jgi:hypothetical protein
MWASIVVTCAVLGISIGQVRDVLTDLLISPLNVPGKNGLIGDLEIFGNLGSSEGFEKVFF